MVRVQTETFEPGALQAELTTAGKAGAVVPLPDSPGFEGLYLEHYPGMTEKVMADLRDRAIDRFDLTDAGIVHRVGMLRTDEVIVWVGTCSRHRQKAFEAACFMMDTLKSQVPLWKKKTTSGWNRAIMRSRIWRSGMTNPWIARC